MGKALRLAVGLRARQYAELFTSCLLRPNRAAEELVSRPEQWRAGAGIVWLGWILFTVHGGMIGDLSSCLVSALFLAWICRPRTGAVRWALWIELWGYCLFPVLVTRPIGISLYAATHISGQPRLVTALIFLSMFALNVSAMFATLRLILNITRAATGRSWTRSLGLALASLAIGIAAAELWEPARRLILHG